MDARQPGRKPLAVWGFVAAACLGLNGCAGFWDEVTSRDYKLKTAFSAKPDPLVVLRDSTDGNQRARAFLALREPRQFGGTNEEQDVVVKVLIAGATQDRQPWCRRAAIASLRTFKDPRVVDGLRDAYYAAGSFSPDMATMLRCQTLEALGEVGNPNSVEFLVRVLREPPVEGPEQDKQQKTDERIAAARALGHFKHYQATEALVGVLKADQDVALRNCTRESLVAVTGRDLPADAKVWDEYLHRPSSEAVAGDGNRKLFGVIPVSW